MRAIILIFIMCDLALAWFAARELLQESERGSKAGGIFGTAPSGAHLMIRTGVSASCHGSLYSRSRRRKSATEVPAWRCHERRENARSRLRRAIELDKAPGNWRLMMKI